MDRGRTPLAGRYRLEQLIGRGGMSTVYRATDSVLGRTVAVKVLLAGLADDDPAYVARFQREARAAAALRNPAVVAVYDVGVDGETRFIVMEHVSGHSLAATLSAGEPLSVEETVRIGEQVAGALAAAHAAGIVHRDIKPANVMIADDGAVKVLDFGVARMLDGTTITQAASVLGTAAYMAPERALGKPGDARSDIYSLGCLLYAMLAGAPPFAADHAAALLHQHVNATPRPLRELRAGVPPGLEALVAEMLAKSPAARPQSAHEVRDRLAAALDPTIATVPLAPVPARSRRRTALLAALGTAVVVLVALLISGGGSSRKPAASSAATTPAATSTTTPSTTTTPRTTTATTPSTQATQPAAPVQSAPKSAKPPGHHGGHPAHPGPAPGHGKPGKDKGPKH
jgi:serine/threonine-protein kinase